MKIILAVANHAYSFVIQANALAKGFSQINIENIVVPLDQAEELRPILKSFGPDMVISVGNWPDFDLLAKVPIEMGYRVIPWIVADDIKITNFVDDYNRLPLILTPSFHCKDNLSICGINPDLIKILPEAVDPDLWYQMNENQMTEFLNYISVPIITQSSVDKYDLIKALKNKIPIIFTTGGEATKKGAQEVIRALAKLDPKIPWIYMIKTWPGPVTFQKSIEELNLAQELNVIDRVRYIVGEFSQKFMCSLMNIASIYAAPSRVEGFGLPHVEAQMCVKAVITMAATSTKETVIDGQTGFLCQVDISDPNLPKANIDDLAKHLELLLTDKVLLQKMGQNAFTHAHSNFSPAIIAQKFVDLINETNV
jgi:glycosyltransferase involved in cell wall biosynthesis